VLLPGSFESWGHVIGGILAVAGVPSFLANQAEKRARMDDEAPQWAAFLMKWHAVLGSDAVTVNKVAGVLEASAEFRDFLPSDLPPL
jgi:hypothetical protein